MLIFVKTYPHSLRAAVAAARDILLGISPFPYLLAFDSPLRYSPRAVVLHSSVSGHLKTSSFHVRETRTSLYGVILTCTIVVHWFLEFVCYHEWLDCLEFLFGVCICVVQVWALANTDYFTQASWPRLGEMNRGSPRVFYASCRSGDQTLVLSERMSRLGGEGLT